MLNITYNPDRPREKGQWYIELVIINNDDPAYSHKLGYWCDLGHLEVAVMRPVIMEAGTLFNDMTILQMAREGRHKLMKLLTE